MSLFSGGLVYEWTQEADDYGLVSINSSTEVELFVDYTNLEGRLAGIDLAAIQSANPSAIAASAKDCASVTASNTAYFPGNFSLPTPPSGIASVITNGLSSASWWTKGALATVTATNMPASVMNYTVSSVDTSNMKLVEYACNDMNAPGRAATYSYPSSSPSCAYKTSRPTGSSGSSNKNAGIQTEINMWPIATIVVGIFIGMVCL